MQPVNAPSTTETANPEDLYFDLMAELDFTKHLGGLDATQALAAACYIGPDSTVLDVGCGVGVTPIYLAKTIGCRVIGIDIRPRFIERAQARIQRQGAADHVECRVADGAVLPFEDDTFDAVIAESVLAFIPDKPAALAEWKRVTKPGGYVGFTEAAWVKDPPPELLAAQADHISANLEIQYPERWQALLEAVDLHDVSGQVHTITARSEARARIKRLGLGQMVRMWGRLFHLLIGKPQYRPYILSLMSNATDLSFYWGYGVWAGRK